MADSPKNVSSTSAQQIRQERKTEVLYDVCDVPIPQNITSFERNSTKKKRNTTELLDVNPKRKKIPGGN